MIVTIIMCQELGCRGVHICFHLGCAKQQCTFLKRRGGASLINHKIFVWRAYKPQNSSHIGRYVVVMVTVTSKEHEVMYVCPSLVPRPRSTHSCVCGGLGTRLHVRPSQFFQIAHIICSLVPTPYLGLGTRLHNFNFEPICHLDTISNTPWQTAEKTSWRTLRWRSKPKDMTTWPRYVRVCLERRIIKTR